MGVNALKPAIDVNALKKLAEERQWTIPELASRLGINYSYLFRILKKEKAGGAKLFFGLYQLCKQEDLCLEDLVVNLTEIQP